jgi:polysaccharide biosynthesis protein PslH
MNTRPKLLSITSEVPWPLNSGGHLRTFHLQNALGRDFDATLVCPANPQTQGTENLPDDSNFRLVKFDVSSRSMASELCRIGLAQWYRAPYSMYFRHLRTQLKRRWNALIVEQRPDFVWLDHIDSFLYLPEKMPTGSRVVIDLHNIYSLILRRLAEESGNRLRRTALSVEANRMARIERELCRRVDAIVAVSHAEADYYRDLGAKRVHVAPNGVDCIGIQHAERPALEDAPVILFVGAMDWQPNISAAISLAKEIFPTIRQTWPRARLNLVGKNPIEAVSQLNELEGVTVTGTVPSMTPYLLEASVFAVPLDSGGGTRLKILEAFAAGVPVVSTPVGAEGIEVSDGVHLRLASRESMASVVLDLLREQQGKQLAAAARKLVEERYDWRSIGRHACDFLRSISTPSAQPVAHGGR